MKLAVQFFGNLRTIDKCASSVKRYLLDEFDCDVFIHTWLQVEHSTRTWHRQTTSGSISDSAQVSGLLEKHYPNAIVALEDADQVACGEEFRGDLCNGRFEKRGLQSMLHSMATVNRLRQKHQTSSGISYDQVLFLRPDLELLEPIDFKSTHQIQLADPKSVTHLIHSPEHVVSGNSFYCVPRMADVFFYGSEDAMNLLSSIDSYLEHHGFNYLESLPPELSCPELLFTHFLNQGGRSSQFVHYKSAIRRADSSKDIVAQSWQATAPLSMQSRAVRFLRKVKQSLVIGS